VTYDWVRAPNPPVRQVAVSEPPPPVEALPPSSALPTTEDFVARAGDRVFFGPDQATLSQDAKNTIDRQAEWLRRYPEVMIRIEGNISSRRPAAQSNFALSQQRADAVKDYLVANGIAASRIETVSNGSSRPIADGSTGDSLMYNRSARIVLTAGVQ
jgi:peptidoglycan-associated lipoprotein